MLDKQKKTHLHKYDNSWYSPKANIIKRLFWYYTNIIFFNNAFFPINFIKVFLLRIFGAKIGKGLIIKPSVNIKYPWLLNIGNHVWIGEKVWIDNLVQVTIKDNVCISQGAYLLTGNHNYKKESFDLITGEIILEEGVWLGAKSIITPGVTCKSHAVLSALSLANKDLEPYSIYQGNPAVKIKERIIE